MIVGFAKAAPEEVRSMFIALFDESKDVFERIDAFKFQSSILLEKYGNGAAQHYQYENAISTYLWLRYPDKYYIYKFGEVKTVASELEADFQFKKGAYADNIRNFRLYDEISATSQRRYRARKSVASR
jgi:5-methylcytosine-specific restriction protein B